MRFNIASEQDYWNIAVAVVVGAVSALAYIFLGPGSGNVEL